MAIGAALAFDVYGTLVDPFSVRQRLEERLPGDGARVMSLWRAKQLEYTFLLTAMQRYEDFNAVTEKSLDFALSAAGAKLAEEDKGIVLGEFLRLSPFPDTVEGLRRLAAAGHHLVVFSNGTPRMLEPLLDSAGLRDYVSEVVSVDEVGSYKPSPVVYQHLADRLARPPEQVRLVSSNPFDVIGGRNAGLQVAWCRRGQAVFDTLEAPPDLVADGLVALADALAA